MRRKTHLHAGFLQLPQSAELQTCPCRRSSQSCEILNCDQQPAEAAKRNGVCRVVLLLARHGGTFFKALAVLAKLRHIPAPVSPKQMLGVVWSVSLLNTGTSPLCNAARCHTTLAVCIPSRFGELSRVAPDLASHGNCDHASSCRAACC